MCVCSNLQASFRGMGPFYFGKKRDILNTTLLSKKTAHYLVMMQMSSNQKNLYNSSWSKQWCVTDIRWPEKLMVISILARMQSSPTTTGGDHHWWDLTLVSVRPFLHCRSVLIKVRQRMRMLIYSPPFNLFLTGISACFNNNERERDSQF